MATAIITTPIGEELIFSSSDEKRFSHLPKCIFKSSKKVAHFKEIERAAKMIEESTN